MIGEGRGNAQMTRPARTVRWSPVVECTSNPVELLYGASASEKASRIAAFREGLAEAGVNEGTDVTVETVVADLPQDQLQEAAAELVRRGVAVIVTTGGPRQVLAAKNANASIPIVFTFGGDPVVAGLVTSLIRPGGNLTGVSIFTLELVPMQVVFLRELLPEATSLAVLVNPASSIAERYAKTAQDAATTLGTQLAELEAGTASEIDAAYDRLRTEHAGALRVTGDPLFETRREQLISLAAATPCQRFISRASSLPQAGWPVMARASTKRSIRLASMLLVRWHLQATSNGL